MLRPANRDVAIAALNALAAYFSAVRFEGDSADSPMGANDTAVREVLAILPALDDALRAMRMLSHMDAEIIRPILAYTTAEGTLMRKKLEPVITPLLRQLGVLRGT